tara:strand:- start:802 stop:1308 length:507 start_codon:yes stop_codon:yes gene_type:complete
MKLNIKNSFLNLINYLPIILLFFFVLSEDDFSLSKNEYISINFVQIIIFYWILKKPEILGYGLIFLAGIINDIVIGLPMGISSIQFLLLCGFASYVRNLTLRPSMINDWLAFAPSILIVNSIYFLILYSFFNFELEYLKIITNGILTFLFYPLFGILFNLISLKYFKA